MTCLKATFKAISFGIFRLGKHTEFSESDLYGKRSSWKFYFSSNGLCSKLISHKAFFQGNYLPEKRLSCAAAFLKADVLTSCSLASKLFGQLYFYELICLGNVFPRKLFFWESSFSGSKLPRKKGISWRIFFFAEPRFLKKLSPREADLSGSVYFWKAANMLKSELFRNFYICC